MIEALRKFFSDEAGAGRIECALIASLVAVFLVAAAETVGARVASALATVATAMP